MSELPIHLFNVPLILPVAGNMATTIESPSINIDECTFYSVQVDWTAGSTPIGTCQLEGSNDNITFTVITDSILPVTGNSGSNLINTELQAYSWVRVSYFPASGSGTLNAIINAKR